MARPPLPPAEPMTLLPLAEIARGGMGSVVMGRAQGGRLSGRVVAVKRLHANIAQDPQFVGMFLDEAWMTAGIRSPNVVRVEAWGQDEQGMFLAVELVEGVSLSRLIKESAANKEPFAERTAAFIGSQICAGLAAAHDLRGDDGKSLGLVHRDLTPGNVLVGFDGVVKIADFGIAKAEERITHTRTGTLKGKPAYMAPEQARGAKVDHRADLFSFGVLLFELLAGRRPWLAKGNFEVMMAASSDPTPDLATIRRGVNPLFVDIVNRCLAKKPEERAGSAAEIQAALDGWRTSRGFDVDDLASLSQFVRRNSPRQIAWFEAAMRGDFTRQGAGAQSFKELEERLDEARGRPRSGTLPAVRPAAGAPAEPQAAAAPLHAPPPISPAPSAPAAAPPSATAEAVDFNRTIAVGDGDMEVVSQSQPDSSDLAATIALEARPVPPGTVLMPTRLADRSPVAGGVAKIQSTELMATSPYMQAVRAGLVTAPRPAAGAPPNAVPGGPGGAAMSGAMAGAGAMGGYPAAPHHAEPLAATLADPPPRRARAGTWIILLVLPLLGAGLFVAWTMRDRILGPSTQPPPRAPSGAPAP